MSVNTAHASNGVLIHAGEYILLHSDSVSMEFSGQDDRVFKGSKAGRIYLTSHRMIFNNKKPGDEMQSFSAPFIALSDVELEQPVFGANYIKGKVRAQPNGNFVGEVKFKLHFKAGGAIEYGQALLRAASTAQSNMRNGNFPDDPPPYTPSGAWHEAPPPAYQPPPGYYGWLPSHAAFTGPAPNTVFMSDNPPPYPGIGGPPAYAPPTQQPYQQPQQPPPQQPPQYQNDVPSWHGFSAPPPDQPAAQGGGQGQMGWGGGGAPANYQPPPYGAPSAAGYGAPGYGAPGYGAPDYGAPGHGAPGYGAPGYGAPGYGAPASAPGYGAPASAPGYGAPASAPGYGAPAGGFAQPGYGAPGSNPYPAGGAMGFSAPPGNSKEAEALASAYNTPYNQRGNTAPPSDMPPAYGDLRLSDQERKNQ